GILSEEDFHSYRPQLVEPAKAACGGYELYTPPPPSGGVTSLAIIQTVEQILATSRMEPWSGRYFHILAEASKLCWRERRQFLADPDFVTIPIDKLLSKNAAARHAEQINHDAAARAPLPASRPDSPHTANV